MADVGQDRVHLKRLDRRHGVHRALVSPTLHHLCLLDRCTNKLRQPYTLSNTRGPDYPRILEECYLVAFVLSEDGNEVRQRQILHPRFEATARLSNRLVIGRRGITRTLCQDVKVRGSLNSRLGS